MSLLESILHPNFANAMGWTLLHSLWQASLLWFLYYCWTNTGAPKKVNAKYYTAWASMLMQLAVSVFTFVLALEQTALQDVVLANTIAEDATVAVALVETPVSVSTWSVQTALNAYLPYLSAIWLLGMGLFLLRLLVVASFWSKHKRNHTITAPIEWTNLLAILVQQMGIRQGISMALSNRVESPLLLGLFKPMILMPVAMLNHLTLEQLELVLIHELAHFKRHDYVFNLIQSIVEAIFYYHPAIWYLGKEVRALREECTDDVVLDYANKPLVYAKTLLHLASFKKMQNERLALGILGTEKEELLTRVRRILNQSEKQKNMKAKIVVSTLLLLLVALVSISATWSTPEEEHIHTALAVDSLPKGDIRIETHEGKDKMLVEIKDGAIEYLKINGKEIPASEYEQYEDRVVEVLNDVPPPPPPPPPPPAPHAPTRVAPPPPPKPLRYPEAPKAPKAPKAKRIVVERSAQGEDVYYVYEGDEMDAQEIEAYAEEIEAYAEEMEQEIERIEEEMEREVEALEAEAERAHREALSEEVHVDIERRRAAIEERKVEMEQRVREQQERIHERVQRIHEKEHEHMQHMHERAQEMHERAQELHEREHERAHRSGDWLEMSLLSDGLIESAGSYTFKLNNKRMKVNGKTVSDKLHQKYKRFYEENEQIDFSQKNSINVSKSVF